jgi:hypothetical protein
MPQTIAALHLRLMCRVFQWCIISSLMCSFVTIARADSDAVRGFLAVNGCVVGPSTVELAVAQKIDRQSFEAYVKDVASRPGTVETGEWLVLGHDVCSIQLPVIVSEIKITDPEVIESFSDINAYAKDGDVGCFLDPDKLTKTLTESRRWSIEKTQMEYIRFLGASIIAGDASFYSPDPLRTPVGFISLRGPCANTPAMSEIKRNHGLLVKHFGDMLRADVAAGEAVCELGSAPSWKMQEIIRNITANQSSNAWMAFEVKIIGLAAGWFEGTSSSSQGIPRPPLCRYRVVPE